MDGARYLIQLAFQFINLIAELCRSLTLCPQQALGAVSTRFRQGKRIGRTHSNNPTCGAHAARWSRWCSAAQPPTAATPLVKHAMLTGYQKVSLRKTSATDALGLQLDEASSTPQGIAVSKGVSVPGSLADMAGVFSEGMHAGL